MIPFYTVLFFNFLLGYFARINSRKNKLNEFFISPNNIVFIAITTIFILMSGLRLNTGLDTWMYRHSYNLIVEGAKPGYEKGFSLFIELLTKISSDSQIFIFATALITNFFIMLAIKRYASYYELSLFIYVTSGYYLVTMNGIRQTFAASIFFYFGIKYIIEGNLKKYTILMFILSYFHNSIPMLYPIYFIAREKSWSKRINLMLIIAVIATLFFNKLIGVGEIITGSYSSYLTDFKEGGANVLRVAVEGVPIILAYYKREILKRKWKFSNIFVNISLLNFIFMLFSLHNWIFARFSMYLSPVNLILTPYLLKTCFKGDERKILYIICIICYFIFYWVDQSFIGDTVYKSLILGIY